MLWEGKVGAKYSSQHHQRRPDQKTKEHRGDPAVHACNAATASDEIYCAPCFSTYACDAHCNRASACVRGYVCFLPFIVRACCYLWPSLSHRKADAREALRWCGDLAATWLVRGWVTAFSERANTYTYTYAYCQFRTHFSLATVPTFSLFFLFHFVFILYRYAFG